MARRSKSVLRQTVAAAQVIVVDDGSTDGSLDAVARFGGRVTLVANGKQGVQAARNAGIALARTDWVALCDSDDLWEPTWLEQLARLRSAEPEVDFVFGNFRHLQDGISANLPSSMTRPPTTGTGHGAGLAGKAGPSRPASPAGDVRLAPDFPIGDRLLEETGGARRSLRRCAGRQAQRGWRVHRSATLRSQGGGYSPAARHRFASTTRCLVRPAEAEIDEIWMLDFVKRNHPAARPYHEIMIGRSSGGASPRRTWPSSPMTTR